jgi:xanthine dehydrogenase molybdopterin-binding subunit B
MFVCQGVLSVIARSAGSQKKAAMLQDMHYRNISQRLVLLRKYVPHASYFYDSDSDA